MKRYNKLVRDRIPEIIEGQGKRVVMHQASQKEYFSKLSQKLVEEIAELEKAKGIKAQAEELADIFEVLRAIAASLGIPPANIENIRRKKLKEKGGFRKRIILEAA